MGLRCEVIRHTGWSGIAAAVLLFLASLTACTEAKFEQERIPQLTGIPVLLALAAEWQRSPGLAIKRAE